MLQRQASCMHYSFQRLRPVARCQVESEGPRYAGGSFGLEHLSVECCRGRECVQKHDAYSSGSASCKSNLPHVFCAYFSVILVLLMSSMIVSPWSLSISTGITKRWRPFPRTPCSLCGTSPRRCLSGSSRLLVTAHLPP